jgi:hypothetical protein
MPRVDSRGFTETDDREINGAGVGYPPSVARGIRYTGRLDHRGCLGAPTDRAVFRLDPLGRFCCVLYYPADEKPGRSVILEFLAQPRRSSG